jgi:hypothetical protein
MAISYTNHSSLPWEINFIALVGADIKIWVFFGVFWYICEIN